MLIGHDAVGTGVGSRLGLEVGGTGVGGEGVGGEGVGSNVGGVGTHVPFDAAHVPPSNIDDVAPISVPNSEHCVILTEFVQNTSNGTLVRLSSQHTPIVSG